MQSFQSDRLRLINDMRERQHREADIARRFDRPTSSIRRAIGTSIVRFGTRLAGEPAYKLARSR